MCLPYESRSKSAVAAHGSREAGHNAHSAKMKMITDVLCNLPEGDLDFRQDASKAILDSYIGSDSAEPPAPEKKKRIDSETETDDYPPEKKLKPPPAVPAAPAPGAPEPGGQEPP